MTWIQVLETNIVESNFCSFFLQQFFLEVKKLFFELQLTEYLNASFHLSSDSALEYSVSAGSK